MENDLLAGLHLLRDELGKLTVSGWENVNRFSLCGNLLDSIISAVRTAQNTPEEGGTENAGTTETDKRSSESGYDKDK